MKIVLMQLTGIFVLQKKLLEKRKYTLNKQDTYVDKTSKWVQISP